MGDESYGPRFVIVGSQTAIKKPVIAPKPNLPKRTPSRADNARRWAPAAYNRNYAEAKRHQVVAEQTATQPIPPPGTVYFVHDKISIECDKSFAFDLDIINQNILDLSITRK